MPFLFLNNLSFKIISIITIILALAIFVLSFIINSNVYSEISYIGRDRNFQAAKYVMSEINNFLIRSKEVINVLSNNEVVIFGDINDKMEKFAFVKEEYNQFKSVYYASTDGKMYLYPEQKLPDGFDPRRRLWYQDAVNGKEVIWTDVYKDASSGNLIISAAKPIYRNN